jgi:hypothetical protein
MVAGADIDRAFAIRRVDIFHSIKRGSAIHLHVILKSCSLADVVYKQLVHMVLQNNVF